MMRPPDGDNNRRPSAPRLFALALRCFPRAFRDQFGRDMIEVFVDQLAAARRAGGVRATTGLRLRTIPAMVYAGFAERRSSGARGHVTSQYPRGDQMLETLTADLRYAVRMLRKSPVFAVVAVLCISIGSGAVTTIFSAMNALVLRPLPGAANGAELVRIERKRVGGNDGVSASYPLYELLRDRTHTLTGVAAWGKASFTVRSGNDAGVEVYGNVVTGNFFSLLGVRPLAGRFFLPEEDQAELAHPVIVISEHLWRTRFNSDTSVVGRALSVNGHPYTVVGIAPAAFSGVDAPITTDAWVPLAMMHDVRLNAAPLASETAVWLRLCGRLKPGVPASAAHQELAALTAGYARESVEPVAFHQYQDIHLSQLTGLPPDASDPLAVFLGLLLGGAVFVLVIASVNVASMLSARAIARRREMAVRAALGASRGRLVRQLLTEVLVLFVLGAAGGIGLAEVATRAFALPAVVISLPITLELSPDWRVMSFALAVSLMTGLVFGLAPALQAADKDIAARVRDGSSGSGTRRTVAGNVLIVGQLALSLVLLVAAGLFARALDRGSRIDPGFDAQRVATVGLNTESWGYDEASARAFQHDVRDRVAALPGVTQVSFADHLPLTMRSDGDNVQIADGNEADATSGVPVGILKIDGGYFDALRIPIAAGRAITTADNAGAPNVMAINESMARKYWPTGAIGRTVTYHGARVTIVGVVRDSKNWSLTEQDHPFVYLPLLQQWEGNQTLIVRTEGEPLAVAPAIERVVEQINPALPRPVVSTLQRENVAMLIPQRVAALVTAILGGVALLLAAVGLYGIISHSSGRRRREIGIRLALGARREDVLRMILGEGVRVTLAGVAVGLVLSAGATRLLVRFLFGINPLDGATFVSVSAMFVGIAALASYLPARRAAAVTPMQTLREE
ncbi:MAG TPA: ABC transporter permease [Gemmatimonadaceae bacterium]|jgi:predicted permease